MVKSEMRWNDVDSIFASDLKTGRYEESVQLQNHREARSSECSSRRFCNAYLMWQCCKVRLRARFKDRVRHQESFCQFQAMHKG